jgi:hypothetical protein
VRPDQTRAKSLRVALWLRNNLRFARSALGSYSGPTACPCVGLRSRQSGLCEKYGRHIYAALQGNALGLRFSIPTKARTHLGPALIGMIQIMRCS